MPLEANLPENRKYFLEKEVARWSSVEVQMGKALEHLRLARRDMSSSPQKNADCISQQFEMLEIAIEWQAHQATKNREGALKRFRLEFSTPPASSEYDATWLGGVR